VLEEPDAAAIFRSDDRLCREIGYQYNGGPGPRPGAKSKPPPFLVTFGI